MSRWGEDLGVPWGDDLNRERAMSRVLQGDDLDPAWVRSEIGEGGAFNPPRGTIRIAVHSRQLRTPPLGLFFRVLFSPLCFAGDCFVAFSLEPICDAHLLPYPLFR